jgi:hypothetical protein
MKNIITILAAALLLLPVAGSAEALEEMPGYFPLEQMGLFEPDELEADIEISGASLEMVAGAAEEQDPALAELVSQLSRIRVRVGPIAAESQDAAAAEFERAIASLESAGWTAIIKVDADETLVRLYSKEADGRIVGLTAIVNDDNEEAVLVNIVGSIDARLIGKLMTRMDNIDFDELGIELGDE